MKWLAMAALGFCLVVATMMAIDYLNYRKARRRHPASRARRAAAADRCDCGRIVTAEPTVHTATVCYPFREYLSPKEEP